MYISIVSQVVTKTIILKKSLRKIHIDIKNQARFPGICVLNDLLLIVS